MTVAIDCHDCDTDVVFHINGEEVNPTEECRECGAVYRLEVTRVFGE